MEKLFGIALTIHKFHLTNTQMRNPVLFRRTYIYISMQSQQCLHKHSTLRHDNIQRIRWGLYNKKLFQNINIIAVFKSAFIHIDTIYH